MMNIDVRDMLPQDWNRVSEIYQQGIDKYGATFNAECPSYEVWDSTHIETCRLVAEVDGNVAGFIVLSPTSPRYSFRGVVEVSIYIDDNYQNCGLGTALMTRLIDQSEKEGFWTLYSSIFEENQGSRKLHEKCGFRLIGSREKIAQDPLGNWRDTVIYERRSEKIM